jgi:hypothetical protein
MSEDADDARHSEHISSGAGWVSNVCERGHAYNFLLPEEAPLYQQIRERGACPICGVGYMMQDHHDRRIVDYSIQLDPINNKAWSLALKSIDGRWVRAQSAISAYYVRRHLEQMAHLDYEGAVQYLIAERLVSPRDIVDFSYPLRFPSSNSDD